MSVSKDNSASGDSPARRYQRDLDAGLIVADAAQAAAVGQLERVFGALCESHAPPTRGVLDRLLRREAPRWQPVRGLYLWGPVGRGKTYLVDTFFDCIPFPERLRIHFHTFMRRTHQALNELQDISNPLEHVAARWASEHRLLCLDEFHVGDITDAMLLANLLDALFADGVTLIATSNEAPDELYKDGLQRARFLPAIEMLKQSLEVFELAGANDYRLRTLEQAPVYYLGVDGACDAQLAERFAAVATDAGRSDTTLHVEGRDIAVRRIAEGIAWFDFAELCGGPRATSDYIEIARLHHTIVISDVPVFGPDDNDAARRFINLIDEIYDRRVNLIVSAAAEPEALYGEQRLAKPFLRTASRLHEMRSHEYLAEPHQVD